MDAAEPVTAVVLCGGRGLRMGGCDKGLLSWQGRPLVEHVLERIAPQVDGCLISANRHQAEYARLGWPVVTDATPDFHGPLAGIEAALAQTVTPWLLVVPCDTPLLPATLRHELLAAARRAGVPAAFARDLQRDHPVVHVVRRECLPALRAWQAQGERAVRGWLAAIGAVAAEFADTRAFANFNSRAELDAPGPAGLR